MSSNSPSLKKILILDDEAEHADMIQQFLESYRFTAEATTLPQTALSLLGEADYDLVITDYKMPEMDGMEFLERARALHPHLPVIVVSGVMNMPELLKVASKRVNYVLKKPIEVEELVSAVREFVDPVPDDVPMAVCHLEGASSSLKPFEAFAGACFASRCFFKNLLEAFQHTRTLFVETYPGVERHLVMQELGFQLGNKDYKTFPSIKAGNLDKASTQIVLEECLAVGEVFPFVSVEGIEECSQEDLLFLDHFLNERPEHLKDLNFVYWIDTEFLSEKYHELPKVLLSKVKHFQVFLPRLSERLPDVSSYASSFFEEQENLVEWTSEALGFLLNNPWTLNYEALMGVLEGWAKNGLPQESEYGRSSLSEALIRKQKKCVELEMALSKTTVPEALDKLGVESSEYAQTQDSGELALIYPELLKA